MPNSFVKIHLVLEIKNDASFEKAGFHWKQGCTKMCDHAETFHANNGYKLASAVIILISPLSE